MTVVIGDNSGIICVDLVSNLFNKSGYSVERDVKKSIKNEVNTIAERGIIR